MITIYLDKGCTVLKESQELELQDNYSAIWFRIENNNDPDNILKFLLSVFCDYIGYFWLASKGNSTSAKIRDLKRAFGISSVPKNDVCIDNDLIDSEGEKVFSDIAVITENNLNALISLVNRQLFGIDSSFFFLRSELPPNSGDRISSYLGKLLMERDKAVEINESLCNLGLLEKYIDEVVNLDGVAAIILRDSNMSITVAFIGEMHVVNDVFETAKQIRLNDNFIVASDDDVQDWLKTGVSVSIFS